jgi:glyoxylase-like metal-dependent hydrolase (beta-lactamase superfamily II)
MAASGEGGRARPEGQAPAFYRYKVGNFLMTALSDGMNVRKLEPGFISNADFAEVEKAVRAVFLPVDKLPVPFNPLLIDTGPDLVLIDTGFADNGPPTAGQLAGNLAAAGVRPEYVTKVVITHFHGDHIAGLRRKNGDLVYPNAEILVPEPEWRFWTDDSNAAGAPEAAKPHFQHVRRVFGPIANEVRRYEWDQEVLPGFTALGAPGHTPGHTIFRIESDGERMLFLSDTTNHPALFVRHPDWSPTFDMDPDQARRTRRRVLDLAASEGCLVASYHYPFPAIGRIVRAGDAFELVPAQWMPVL